MTVPVELDWQGYRYFPYERRLAEREVCALLKAMPAELPSGFHLQATRPSIEVVDRLTYFHEVRLNGSIRHIPVQARLEASAAAPYPQDTLFTPKMTRQRTRYSVHGIHEYRGKFNPQIVRAVANMLNIRRGGWVFDPFCGSGTSLVECAHLGLNCVGEDVNPLAVLIARTKLHLLKVDRRTLEGNANSLLDEVGRRGAGLAYDRKFPDTEMRRLRRRGIDLPNREYLGLWFAESVLAQLEMILGTIENAHEPAVRNFARVVLSDCLRTVSWQDPGDLRIRRRKDPQPNYPAVPVFLQAFRRRLATVVRAREILPRMMGTHRAVVGDSKSGLPRRFVPRRGFDGAITSPPYATALPYIDTQRLSLAFLGLLTASEIHSLEHGVIGSREITRREREDIELVIDAAGDALPDAVLALCRQALRLTEASSDGFRRRNIGALLFRYFEAMRAVLTSSLALMRRGACLAIVVGPNRSILGGKEVVVNTPELLALLGEHVGWQRHELIELDAYPRFDMHQKNSIRSEALVVLRAP